jgi:hypothetical protein
MGRALVVGYFTLWNLGGLSGVVDEPIRNRRPLPATLVEWLQVVG